jgi:hypothetical protein
MTAAERLSQWANRQHVILTMYELANESERRETCLAEFEAATDTLTKEENEPCA